MFEQYLVTIVYCTFDPRVDPMNVHTDRDLAHEWQADTREDGRIRFLWDGRNDEAALRDERVTREEIMAAVRKCGAERIITRSDFIRTDNIAPHPLR